MTADSITFEKLALELSARPESAPHAEAIELQRDELLTLRGHKESLSGGWFDPPMGSEPEKLLGLPIRVVSAPRGQRIVPLLPERIDR